jgi:hypothetical protein
MAHGDYSIVLCVPDALSEAIILAACISCLHEQQNSFPMNGFAGR